MPSNASHPARRLATPFLAVLLAACAASTESTGATPRAGCPELTPVYPDTAWARIDTPECAGFSSEGLDAVRDRLTGMATTSMLAIVAGRVLFEYGDPLAVSYLASVRKSILSMLYGIYVERGAIDLDRTLADLGIDDVGGLSDQEKQATVRHLISARSGIYHEASNGGDDLASAPPRGSRRPGEYYLYNNWDFNAAGTVFEMETGQSIFDALERDLAVPIGMRDFDRSAHRRTGDESRSRHLAYHMHLSTRDMARVGYLMLRHGRWIDRQIVPPDWVAESTRAITPVSEMNPVQRRDGPFGYGYLWWVFDAPGLPPEYEGAFTGLGAYGQHILVMPALDLVVAHKTAPRRDRSVSHESFLQLVEMLVQARCPSACAGTN